MADNAQKSPAPEGEPLRVKDKRHFTAEGERRDEAPAAPASGPGQAEARDRADTATGAREAATWPGIDFASFALSLSSAALLYLGEFENPETGKREVNLPYARQHIEIITMLREKTRGNLNADEERLVDTLLAELHLKYVRASR